MAGLIIRAGENLTQVWGQVRNRAVMPGGLNVGDPTRRRAGDTRSLQELVALRGSQIQLLQMVAIPGMQGKLITPDEITVGLFRQVMPEYEPSGHKAAELAEVLRSADANTPLNWVNLQDDGRGFAGKYSELTGRQFRNPTEAEWEAAKHLLTGNLWTWTETKYSNDTFVLRNLGDGGRFSGNPEDRYCGSLGLRLVEDVA